MISYEVQLIEQINSAQRILKALPLNLGGIAGASGGAGGPPGGFIGVLPQRKVAYDTTEAETLDTPLSGYSLLDNLNHIRYRIRQVELGVISGFVENFLDLEDTPDTYVTYSGMAVIVNASETGLEFVPFPSGGGGAGIPGGNDTNVQFNNAGAFEGTDFFKWDNTNTGLYIGTPGTLPLDNGLIDLVSEGTDFDAKYQLWKFGEGGTPTIVGIRARGSYVSPSGLVPNDEIFGFWARGFNGADWTDPQGSFQFVADETWSGSGTGVRAEMYITPRQSTTLSLVQDWQSDFINMYKPINMFDHLISNVTDPIDPQDVMTKNYADDSYAPLAKGVTNGDSHDHVGGDGATLALLKFLTDSNEFYRGASLTATPFSGTINGTPSGATLVYTPTAGNESDLAQYDGAAAQTANNLTAIVLRNSTRNEELLISNVNLSTNTITFTTNVPGTWVNGDVITTHANMGSNFRAVEIKNTSVIPSGVTQLLLDVTISDTAGSIQAWFQGYETFSASKTIVRGHNAGVNLLFTGIVTIPLLSRRILHRVVAPAGATGLCVVRIIGYQ
jgi:hypothetical protein